MSSLKIASHNDNLTKGSIWLLKNNINGYVNFSGNELSTQALAGRKFEVIFNPKLELDSFVSNRIEVRLLEDGYRCFFEFKDLLKQIVKTETWKPIFFDLDQINNKVPNILRWIEERSKVPNNYLWGGTIGPNFDCSGLIQTAFALEGIWLPRDAYQQERFCTKVKFNCQNYKDIIPGDLLFFGDLNKCSHVAIYKGKGLYWHSSGKKNGRDGIGLDNLIPIDQDPISSYYQSILRGIGRVEYCHDGSALE